MRKILVQDIRKTPANFLFVRVLEGRHHTIQKEQEAGPFALRAKDFASAQGRGEIRIMVFTFIPFFSPQTITTIFFIF